MLAQQRRFGVHQGHGVLELIAEAEGAAGLVKAGAGPHAAGQRLVDEPTIGEEIEGWIGSFDMHDAESLAPIMPDAFQRVVGVGRPAEPLRQVACLFFTRGRADNEDDVFFLTVLKGRKDLHGQARV